MTLYGLLLRLYRRHIRERFGAGVHAAFAEEYAHARAGGRSDHARRDGSSPGRGRIVRRLAPRPRRVPSGSDDGTARVDRFRATGNGRVEGTFLLAVR
jgi:hypothetical protein